MTYRLPLMLTALVALTVACGGDDGATPTPTPTAPPGFTPAMDGGSPEPSPKVEPVPERTGDAALDAIIEAFVLQDMKSLLPHLRYKTLPCGVDDGQAAMPPCRPDQEVGAPVDVMPVSACEFGYYRPHEFELLLPAYVSMDIYSVYEATPLVRYPADYVMLLAQPDPDDPAKKVATEVSVKGGRIVGVAFSCALTPEELVQRLELGEPLWTPGP